MMRLKGIHLRDVSVRVWLCVVPAVAAGCNLGGRPAGLQPAPASLIRQVADRVVADFPEPPPFDWGEAVLMTGMMRAGATLSEPRYVEVVKRWADRWDREGLTRILAGSPDERLRGRCGHWAPGLPILMLHERNDEETYLAMADQIASFITDRAARTTDGGLTCAEDTPQLHADALYMACPVLARLAMASGRPELLEEAITQLDIYTDHLQDKNSGLLYRSYDDTNGKVAGGLWGRGNAWAAMAYIETLKHMERGKPRFEELAADFRQLTSGLLAVQNPETHLWHTVLDRPETPLETSASAMILASLADARQWGLLRTGNRRALNDAWSALAARVDDAGRVTGVSSSTLPRAVEAYTTELQGTFPWGTGAFLMAAAALMEMP